MVVTDKPVSTEKYTVTFDAHNMAIQERMSIVDSLVGIIPSDIALEAAREERLSKL